jgi:ATP-dependent exoDNAse (exonuclease V) beta subunit
MSEAAARTDAAARTQASDPGVSVLLEAPAGSGKTAVLTQRFLKLLCTAEDAGEILAITFTRKAAAEMRARVTRALRGQIPDADPSASELRPLAAAALAHGAARGWRLAEEPQSLRIQTIDSFNYWLANQLPVASGVGGALTVTDAAEELYQRAARRTLVSAETEATLAPDAQLLFERLDNHWMNFERLLADMLRARGHWLSFVFGEDPQVLCRRVNESLAAITRAQLAQACATLPQALRRAAAALPGITHLGEEAADLASWKELARLTLTASDWRKQLSARLLGAAFADSATAGAVGDLIAQLRQIAGAREALLALKAAPAAQLSAEDAQAIGALSRLLSYAAAQLHAEFAAARLVDHTYITGASRAALTEAGAPTELALRAGLTLRHILVDEFQDTSLAQFQLLQALTVSWEEGDGRTLFVVGDPMQSIYRFRDAEVGLFLKARAHGIGTVRLTALRLTRNFRATEPLVEFTNEVFTQVFPVHDDLRTGAVAYSASVAARAAATAAPEPDPIILRLFGDRLAEARALAARIQVLRARDPAAKSAVLVQAHAHAVPIVAALRAQGLQALGVDLVPLGERVVVADLVQLARALYDLADRSAWLAVLRAPWCGARLASLSALSGLNDRQLIFEAMADPARLARCAADERPRLARLRAILESALSRRATAAPADWLEGTWLQLGAADAYTSTELEDARAFFAALAERAAAFQWRGPQDFAPLLKSLFSTQGAPDANPVQVMTIHRAKGLEFEHVFVPALERTTRAPERRLLRWIDLPGESEDSELLIAPAPIVGEEEGALNAYLKDLLREREANERKRLLYVAATRARRTLWLSAAPRTDAQGAVRPDRRSLLAALWPALAPRFEGVPMDAPQPALVSGASVLRRLVAAWQPPPLPVAAALTHLPAAHLAPEPVEFSWVGETQRHIGTLVHAWLARLGQQQTLPTLEMIESERAALHAQLSRCGVPAAEQARAAQLILTALSQTLADERGRWILSRRHREAHAELALTGVSAGRLRNVIIDRSFIDASGTRWVVDFKTSRHEGGGLDEFLAAELARYRAQLETYRELAGALGPQPVRAALYFPLLQAFREL